MRRGSSFPLRALTLLLLLVPESGAFGQGAFGDFQFESDVERVSGEIGKLRLKGMGERPSPTEAPAESHWERKKRSLEADAEARARAEEKAREASLRQAEADRKAREKAARRQRRKDLKAAEKTLNRTHRVHTHAYAEWKALHDMFDELNNRWRYAARLLEVAHRDGSRLVWGLDGRIDANLRRAENELAARLTALRRGMNAYALLYRGLQQPLRFHRSTFQNFRPGVRKHLAAGYLEDLEATRGRIDRAEPALRRAYPGLERESAKLVTAARAFQELVEEARQSSRPWLVHRWQEVRAQAASRDPWRGDVVAALKELRAPPAVHRPDRLAELWPGDVVLLDTGGAKSRLVHVVGTFFAGRTRRDNPAAHVVTLVGRDAAGRALFLNHVAGRGSHIMGEAEFLQEYGSRKRYVARPQSVVNGRILLETALEAVRSTKRPTGTDFGLLGEDTVCSEEAALAVAKSTGADLIRKRMGPVDVHPSDFFDDDRLGWYFVVNPMVD